MMENINNYGELCEEIKRVEKAIEDVRHGFCYEQGDEMDLQLYLIHLKKVKTKNEKRYRIRQEIGVYECEKCKSGQLNITSTYDISTKSYEYTAKCSNCGHIAKRVIPNYKYIDILNKVDNEFKSI